MSGNVALAGMMGVGKTTIGRALAERLGRRLVDTDEEIVGWVGMGIPTIFAEHGEPEFRRLEQQVVRRLSELDDLVIALGGGVVLDDGNVADLTLTGVIIELHATVEVLAERLARTTGRPLLQAEQGLPAQPRGQVEQRPPGQPRDQVDIADSLSEVLAERADRYAAVADHRVDAARPITEVVEDIVAWLRERPTVLTPSEFEAILP